LWKWLLLPRGLTILEDSVVVYGMNKVPGVRGWLSGYMALPLDCRVPSTPE
jgi:hypothetical protein